ncbi:WecB/TagA/CpsF family glycosyltransferase [Clostridium perfringens]|uniref:WecB/TagA/CpsF family glycosyltransferase n=1 Tax=Clostridium perfringens TaxID=1502 RepID=UPI0011206DF3|nr:WecB/TagA/CpsF family glycosyltransferase [Clostridium perfringens]TPE20415.1 WecB/TagA/CpsF family glycosyltransferase [Clostridium perfringens]
MSRVKILNTEVDNITMDEAVNKIDNIINKRTPKYVVTPNLDHIVQLEKDLELQEVYKNAELIVTDGMPLIWISHLNGMPIKEKISGSDLFPAICKLADKRNYSIFLLGAAEGVAKKAGEKLQKKYPGLNIAGTFSPEYGFEKDENKIKDIINIINESNVDILAVGLGAPKQEKFIYRIIKEINVPVSLAIGATIDFEAGNVKRAPKWMQENGLEWFYRLIKEPRRLFKRYLKDGINIIPLIIKYRGR